MTEEELKKRLEEDTKQKAEEQARRQQQEAQFREQFYRQQQEQQRRQQQLQQQLQKAQQSAIHRQQLLDESSRHKFAIIAAVDSTGGLSKNGEIPWHYKEDFNWFKKQTTGNICVMGRGTYEDINKRLGDKAKDSVLPNRKCFVVSSTLKQQDINNATVITSAYDVDSQLTNDDLEKTVFYIGGESIFNLALSIADELYLTFINKDFECDKFFPIEYVDKLFDKDKTFKTENDDLRFVTYKRKGK